MLLPTLSLKLLYDQIKCYDKDRIPRDAVSVFHDFEQQITISYLLFSFMAGDDEKSVVLDGKTRTKPTFGTNYLS